MYSGVIIGYRRFEVFEVILGFLWFRYLPEARHNCVATSGCQATTFHRILETVSLNLIIGSFFLKSQTTHLAAKVLAIMCCTCKFQATDKTSSKGCVFEPKKQPKSQTPKPNTTRKQTRRHRRTHIIQIPNEYIRLAGSGHQQIILERIEI